MSDENESWLPNLVGGVSIWKLAPDLNEAQFFDGRLLVPDTEGSDSLPVRVEWDLTGLVPLSEARAKFPERVEAAVTAFFDCLERTAQVFEKGGSGYDKYKAAFTVPALDADGGAHYFFDPADDKLKVVNWGASPRKIRHEKHYLFGYQDFGALIEKEQAAAATRGELGASPGVSRPESAEGARPSAEAAEGGASEEKDGEKKDEKEESPGGRPWWMWALYLVVLASALVLAFVLLRDCGGTQGAGGDVSAADAGTAEQPIYGHASDDAGPPATALHDGGASTSADASAAADAGARASDGGANASDGGASASDAGSPSAADAGAGSGNGSGGGSGSGGGNGSGSGSGSGGSGPPTNEDGEPIYGESSDPVVGHVYWAPGAGGRSVTLPSREYYHPDAMQWRIVGGTGKVYDYAGSGSSFRVYLRPAESFDGVRVQWRDRDGNWHDH